MEFKRRSTFRDKVISVLATLMSVVLLVSALEMWQRTGNVETLDILGGLAAFGIATIFTNIKRFTYIKFEKGKMIWYRCIFFKQEIQGVDIKEIKAKMNHVILVNAKGKELWIPMAFVREADGSNVIEEMKKF